MSVQQGIYVLRDSHPDITGGNVEHDNSDDDPDHDDPDDHNDDEVEDEEDGVDCSTDSTYDGEQEMEASKNTKLKSSMNDRLPDIIRRRDANIARNRAKLIELGIDPSPTKKKKKRPKKKITKEVQVPTTTRVLPPRLTKQKMKKTNVHEEKNKTSENTRPQRYTERHRYCNEDVEDEIADDVSLYSDNDSTVTFCDSDVVRLPTTSVVVKQERTKRKSRRKIVKALDNSVMKKNAYGIVEISKMSFHPEKAIDNDLMCKILGLEGLRMTSEERQAIFEWFHVLKINAGSYCRAEIVLKVVENAKKFGMNSILEMQNAWLEAGKAEVEKRQLLASQIVECVYTGYFADREGEYRKNWKFAMEQDRMKEFEIKYFSSEENDGRIGCLAMQASSSRRDIMKRILVKRKDTESWIDFYTKKINGGNSDAIERTSSARKRCGDPKMVSVVGHHKKRKAGFWRQIMWINVGTVNGL
jgi:hypothetical protein